ncbi:MAG: peptidoglycan DD-metalloendopeptidase family protein [Gemmatimonadales bacterium]|jgi:septal ring factor EnvC (AmiA/AmiB activator)
MLRRTTALTRVGLSVALLLAIAAVVPAQDPIESLDEQLELSRKRLEDIRAERQRLRNEMQALTSAVHDEQAELDNLNRQVGTQEALLREMDHQLGMRDQQVLEATADLLRTQDQLVEKKVLFARRVRDLYKRGPLGDTQILLAAESFADLINRYQYLYLVALHDRLLVSQVEELSGLLQEKYDRLQREVRGLRQVRDDKVDEIQDLYYLEQERRRRLSTVRGLRSTTEQRLGRLQRDEQQLNGLIERLEREREAAEALAAAAPTRGTLSETDRGRLDWPLNGRVLYTFGQQRNPDGTVIPRNGIGIAADPGTPVKAVAGGTVFFAQPYLGYGPSVILSHGGGYYSLYLHLSEILVSEGQAVILGQTIGRVGGSATPEGPHLEFQIYINNQAVDPLPWLRRTRG